MMTVPAARAASVNTYGLMAQSEVAYGFDQGVS